MKIFEPLQLVWARITFNRLTTVYIFSALLYCIVQVLCQVSLWNVNLYAGDLGKAILARGNLSASNFAYLEPHTGVLRICNSNEAALTPDKSCDIVWLGPGKGAPTKTTNNASDSAVISISSLSKRNVQLDAIIQPGSTAVTAVRIIGIHDDDFAVGPSHQLQHQKDIMIANIACVQSIKWPTQILLQGKREDVLLTAFQIWVLGISIMAVLNESIPHVFGAFIAHVVAASWSAFQIWESSNFQNEYTRNIVNGACQGVDFLPRYFAPRTNFGIAMGVVNFLAVFSSGFLTFKLVRLFGWNTFKRIGASVTINRVYKLALTLSILIQLSIFFIVSSMGLWIDQIYSGIFAPFGQHPDLYKALYIVAFVALLPWLALGWFAVRLEHRIMMHIFLSISVILIGGFIGICFSTSFQLTFAHWRFFTTIWAIAFVLLISTTVLGFICRLNFGKGLAEYLQQQELPDEMEDSDLKPDEDSHYDEEKVEFPEDVALPQFQSAKAPPAPLVPSKLSFYRTWGRSAARPSDTPPVPYQAPPMPPPPTYTPSFGYTADLEKGEKPSLIEKPSAAYFLDRSSSTSTVATVSHVHDSHRDTTNSSAFSLYGATGNITPFADPAPPLPAVQRSNTVYTSYTAHRKNNSNHTIESFMSGVVDPGMPISSSARALQRSDTASSTDTATIGGRKVTRTTSNSSTTSSMKTGSKPKNWTIE